MINRTVVIRKKSCSWQPKIKTNNNTKKVRPAGFINPVFVVCGCAVFAGFLYLYSINQTAVKGLKIRQIEKEIAQMQTVNENLKIKEAGLKSLYHIEESSKNLNMSGLKAVEYIEENGPVALASPSSARSN